jgi:putative membrane protein
MGALIIAARSLARQAALLDEAPKRGLLRGICGFSAGLAARLRWRNPANMEEAAAIANWIEGVPASPQTPPMRRCGKWASLPSACCSMAR